jgi:hypothetical protein
MQREIFCIKYQLLSYFVKAIHTPVTCHTSMVSISQKGSKGAPVYAVKRGGEDVEFHSFLKSIVDKGKLSSSRPAA